MRIVIIGGTGHVGTFLVPRLVMAGHEVISVSRQMRKPYQSHHAWNQVKQVEIDRVEADKKNIFGKNRFTLVDRKEFDYRVRFEAGLMKIYNPKPVDMLYELEQFNRFVSIAIDLKETHTKEAIALLRFYVDKINQRKPTKKSKFTRGHYDKAVI